MERVGAAAVGMRGRSLLRVWVPGVLETALRRGLDLPCAQEWALRQGALQRAMLVRNTITVGGINLVAAMLIDESVQFDDGLTYHAIGTGTGTPSPLDPQLDVEVARVPILSRSRAGAEASFSAFYTAAQCTYHIKEAGIFGSSTATSTPDSGVLFARYLQEFDNSGGSYDLTFDYQLSIEVA